MITNKTLDQFMADYFRGDEFVEINANFLQGKLRDLIKNERLAMSQMRDYKLKYEIAMFKVEAMSAEKLIQELDSDVRYRINERV